MCNMPRLRRILLVSLAMLFMFVWMSCWNKSSGPPRVREPQPVHVPPSRLMDLTDFEYLTNPKICETSQDVLAVILIHSHPSNVDMRQAARDHLSNDILKEIGFRRAFLIGQALKDQTKYPAVKQKVIDKENDKYHDLVQGNFIEHYRNLTYKHMMGLTWSVQHCPQAEFIIKMDDDIAVDVFQIRQMIRFKYRDLKNELLGLIQIDSHPLRTNASKWKVTHEEFKGNTYPPFLSGWCYIAPRSAVQKIVSKAHMFSYFWIDDVLVTGIMSERLAIEREGLNHRYTTHTAHLRCCIEEPYSPLKYYCDYIAGPTGGDHNILARSLEQFNYCYKKGCSRRSGKDLIARTCVITQRDFPTGRGIGEVIPLN